MIWFLIGKSFLKYSRFWGGETFILKLMTLSKDMKIIYSYILEGKLHFHSATVYTAMENNKSSLFLQFSVHLKTNIFMASKTAHKITFKS